MGKITIRREQDTAFVRTADVATEENKARYGEGELTSSNRPILPLDGESLQLFEVKLDPDTEIQPHATARPRSSSSPRERSCSGPSAARSGPPSTSTPTPSYGFRAGPEGCRFYNFRGVPAAQYLTKDELVAQRRSAPAAS